MPTVLRINGFRFFFFSDEHLPLHIHVEKGDGYMRVELDTFTVTKYLEAGNYYWNSGIFMFKAGVFLEELQMHSPKIYEELQKELEMMKVAKTNE